MINFLLALVLGAPVGGMEQPDYIVKVVLKEGNSTFTSSGALVSHSLVLTCQHCIDNHAKAGDMFVLFKDGTKIKATYVTMDDEHDVGLVKLVRPVLTVPARISENSAKKGDTIKIQGFPLGKDYAETTGNVEGFTVNKFPGFIINDSAIQGMSGGPALNAEGEIVGLLFGSTANESYCASLGAIKDSLKSRLSECCPTPTKGE